MKRRVAGLTGCLLAAVAVAQSSVWYRVSSTNQSPRIVEFTPEGFVTWSNEIPDGHGVLERSSWADGFWSSAFGATRPTPPARSKSARTT